MIRSAIGIAGLLMMVGFVALMAYCEHVENPIDEYATYADAVEAGAVDRGWIPSFVPPTAAHIRDAHNLDTNHQWLQFRLSEADAREMVAGMHPVSVEDARCALPSRWSVPLRRLGTQPDLSGRPEVSKHLHADGSRSFCVAVDWSSRMVFAWTQRR
jgi:hypothetical protein